MDRGARLAHPAAARRHRARRTPSGARLALSPWLFVLPYLVAFVLFRFGPAVAGFLVSLTNWNLMSGSGRFVGVDNYARLATDPQFRQSLLQTLYFMALTVPALVILGLLLAVLVNQRLRGRSVVRTAIFMPYVVMSTVVGVIWLWMLNTDVGVFNYLLSLLGIHGIPWLSDPNAAMPAIALTTIWWTVGFNMIIFLAGLQDIPAELEEAARVDGAGAFTTFRAITLPLLRPVIFVVVMLTLINTFEVFDQIYVMTGGGPGLSTLTIIQFLYYEAFQFYHVGYASAVAYVVLAVLVALALIQRRFLAPGDLA
ncbi:MAG: sugar ABC transporter permease [Acidimicrobiales bacterium]|nr:sugar ABC transporter permease [Acidimicrobiales bacterium]